MKYTLVFLANQGLAIRELMKRDQSIKKKWAWINGKPVMNYYKGDAK